MRTFTAPPTKSQVHDSMRNAEVCDHCKGDLLHPHPTRKASFVQGNRLYVFCSAKCKAESEIAISA